MQSFLYAYFGVIQNTKPAYVKDVKVKLPQNEHTTSHQLAMFHVSKKPLLFAIKQRADELQLPYLERKLGKLTVL